MGHLCRCEVIPLQSDDLHPLNLRDQAGAGHFSQAGSPRSLLVATRKPVSFPRLVCEYRHGREGTVAIGSALDCPAQFQSHANADRRS